MNQRLAKLDLFRGAPDWWYNACLNYGQDDWWVYANGYKRAAEVLIEHVKQTRSDLDSLIYPIVFSYRQYIELGLKQLARNASDLLEEEFSLKRSHDLDLLWNDARSLLERVEAEFMPESDPTDWAPHEAIIAEFAKVDPLSMSFRYPEDKKGNKAIPDIIHINVRQLQDLMNTLTELLEGADISLSVLLDQRNEFRLDQCNEFSSEF